jgi:hypothetical protein
METTTQGGNPMTTKTTRTPRLTREERQALQRLREYLAQFKPPTAPKQQSVSRQDASV